MRDKSLQKQYQIVIFTFYLEEINDDFDNDEWSYTEALLEIIIISNNTPVINNTKLL